MAGLPKRDVRNAAIVEAVVVGGKTQAEVAREYGISKNRVGAIMKAGAPLARTLRMVSTQGFIDKSGDIMDRILDSMSDEDIAKATLNQRAVTYGILAQNRLLMEGKATVIFGNERRERVDDLAAQLMAEAKRRGVTIDASATEVSDEAMGGITDGG